MLNTAGSSYQHSWDIILLPACYASCSFLIIRPASAIVWSQELTSLISIDFDCYITFSSLYGDDYDGSENCAVSGLEEFFSDSERR